MFYSGDLVKTWEKYLHLPNNANFLFLWRECVRLTTKRKIQKPTYIALIVYNSHIIILPGLVTAVIISSLSIIYEHLTIEHKISLPSYSEEVTFFLFSFQAFTFLSWFCFSNKIKELKTGKQTWFSFSFAVHLLYFRLSKSALKLLMTQTWIVTVSKSGIVTKENKKVVEEE